MSERIDLAGDSPLATLARLLLTDPTRMGGSVLDGGKRYRVTSDAYSQHSPTIPPTEGILYGAHMIDEFDGAGNIYPLANEMRVTAYTPTGTTSDILRVEQDGSLRPMYGTDPEKAALAAGSILAAYGIEL